jgi:probable addiction module antidote protein
MKTESQKNYRDAEMKIATIKKDTIEYPAGPDRIRAYLREVVEEGDSQALIIALGNAVRAVGVTKIARKTNLSRMSLYKSFAPNKTPRFDTVKRVLEALGCKLTVM